MFLVLQMLEVEQKLIQGGYLKTDDEVAEFRSGVAVAEDLEQYAGGCLILLSLKIGSLTYSFIL